MMHTPPLLPGLRALSVATPRLHQHIITSGSDDGVPVIFVHGNVSAARFWEETLTALPDAYRGIAPDLRGYGRTDPAPVDATRGMRDWSDDLIALLDTLSIRQAHLVGWSMGAGVIMQLAIDQPGRVLSMTLVAPMSPYGFGGTGDAHGTPTTSDFAGSGGGTASPLFVKQLAAGDTTADDQNSPRNVMNAFYVKPPFHSPHEDIFVAEMLTTRIGDDHYPGDLTPSQNWPMVAPGVKGINNAFSPKYCNLSAFAHISPKPPVMWIRGADDQIISDTSLFDLSFLGQLGFVPGWPGAEVSPVQPMLGQIRAVLDTYQGNGGHYTEHVLADVGHSPHIENPAEFQRLLLANLSQ